MARTHRAKFILLGLPLLVLACTKGGTGFPGGGTGPSNKKVTTGKEATPIIADVARNSDGSIKLSSFSDAQKYCAQIASHIPSARELELSTRGSDSIKESGFPNVSKDDPQVKTEISSMSSIGFIAVYSYADASKISIDFYYKADTSPQTIDATAPTEWTSSKYISNGGVAMYQVFVSDSRSIGKPDDPSTGQHSIRCALN